ncbi:MAG TPA: SpoIIIAH-like family protein [Desulfosporosinus sp.]|nr:SpoIIIAH-like family protein [Desulfosporosinus sp.]
MFKSKVKRPVILFLGHKSKIWWGGVVSLAVILAAFGIWAMMDKPPSYLSVQSSLPVTASVVDTSIKFEVETVQQNISGENYFVNYRLKRDQFRQERKAMLSELLDSTVNKSKEQAQEKWLELSTKIHKEGEIENLLKMKGFQDAVADVFVESVTVIVYAPSLTPNEVSIIQDIVVRVTKVRMDKIAISVRK